MPSRQPPPPPPHSPPPSSTALLLISAAAAALLILLALIFYLLHKRTTSTTIRRFSHSHLRRATSSFSFSNRIGRGGSGSVFKAVLPNSPTPVAVKLIDAGTVQARTEFMNELLTLSRIGNRSTKVVNVLGFAKGRSTGGEGLAIVYELMEKGSLQEALFEKVGGRCVDELRSWRVRFGIIIDVAEGLCFLHNGDEFVVVHGDVKASNVLLDGEFRAKIGDFGLAKMRYGTDSGVESLTDFPLEGLEKGVIGSEVRLEVYDEEEEVEEEEMKVVGVEKVKRVPREWWREEYCEEIEKRKSTKRGQEVISGSNGGEWSSESGGEGGVGREKRKKRMSDVVWCYSGLMSFDLLKKSRRSIEECGSGLDTPRSQCLTSTPSMKGTVCYTAPEYSCGGELTEKCDVFSFGVLLLVIVSGRRPLEMATCSPMLDFEKANLVSWARQLAQSDSLLDLVDPKIQSLDKEQAMRCLTVALLCLQRSASKRPIMKEVVGMLSGSSDLPQLPLQFSPSPPCNFTFMSPSIPR